MYTGVAYQQASATLRPGAGMAPAARAGHAGGQSAALLELVAVDLPFPGVATGVSAPRTPGGPWPRP
jgi:hypothetical protein